MGHNIEQSERDHHNSILADSQASSWSASAPVSEQIFRVESIGGTSAGVSLPSGGSGDINRGTLIKAGFVKILTKTDPLTGAEAVTLRLPPEQARKVVLARNIGKYSLVLRQLGEGLSLQNEAHDG
jgi:hypothetical protein